jgi:hypothetical protein
VWSSTGENRYEQWWADNVAKTLHQGRVGMNLFAVAAGGKPVEGGSGALGVVLKAKLAAYADLPAEQRRPVIAAPEAGKATTFLKKDYRIPPPPGGLVLTSYLHYLRRTEEGQIGRLERPVSQVTVTDFGQTWCPFNDNYATPGVGWMWIAEHEWKALVPANPKQGDLVPIPRPLRQRLLLYPPWESTWSSPDAIRTDTLVARVQEVTPGEIRLRLEGSVLLIEESSQPLGHVFKPKSQTHLPAPYHRKALDARLEGTLVYDRRAGKFTRFDVVGLGDTWGAMLGGLMYTRWPIGFSFELDLSDYEEGYSRGIPAAMISTGPRAYWNPGLRSRNAPAKDDYYVYPQ